MPSQFGRPPSAPAGARSVLQATGTYPFPNPSPEHALLFDIYGARYSPAQLVTGSLVDGRYTLDTPAGPATLAAVEGGTLQVSNRIRFVDGCAVARTVT